MTTCVCATHSHCFDGLVSAALFSELLSRTSGETKFRYVGCGYGAQEPPTVVFDGNVNASLDYRYTRDNALTHYFDHHPTAFRTEEDRSHFESRKAVDGSNFHWDPTSVSCARMVGRVAEKDFNLDFSAHHDLLRWADLIDGALFQTVVQATDRTSSEMRLLGVIEHFSDTDFLNRAVPILRAEGISGLAQAKFVKEKYRKLAPKFRLYNKRVRSSGTMKGDVAVIDLTDELVSVVTKFVHYREYDQATYSVIVAKRPGGVRLSIGHNPWSGRECKHDIGAICARYGGGGHRVVGGISLPRGAEAQGLSIAEEITSELTASAGSEE